MKVHTFYSVIKHKIASARQLPVKQLNLFINLSRVAVLSIFWLLYKQATQDLTAAPGATGPVSFFDFFVPPGKISLRPWLWVGTQNTTILLSVRDGVFSRRSWMPICPLFKAVQAGVSVVLVEFSIHCTATNCMCWAGDDRLLDDIQAASRELACEQVFAKIKTSIRWRSQVVLKCTWIWPGDSKGNFRNWWLCY